MQEGPTPFRYDGECRDGVRHGRGLCRYGAADKDEAYFDGLWAAGSQARSGTPPFTPAHPTANERLWPLVCPPTPHTHKHTHHTTRGPLDSTPRRGGHPRHPPRPG